MIPARGQTSAPFPVRPDFSPEARRTARRYGTSLEIATKNASPSRMNPSSRAVAADIVKVTLSAGGAPVSAAERGVAATVATAAGIANRVLATLAGLITDGLAAPGVAAEVPVTGVTAAAGTVPGEAAGEGVPATDLLGAAVLAAPAGALTVTVSFAVGSWVMAGLVAASAVAVRVTDVTEVAPEATWIWACIWSVDGVTSVAIDPIVHVAEPSPPGQRLVNTGSSPCGAPVSVTATPEAGPFSAETCTVKEAAWPRRMPDSDAWTLTHSSAAEEDGDGVVAEGSGSHWELVAASAVTAVLSADAGGIPCPAISRLPARQPPTTRQAPAARTDGSRGGVRLPFTGQE